MAGPRAEDRRLVIAIALCASLLGVLVFRHLSRPLLWQDEAQTAALAAQVLAFGYPKVHGGHNLAYDLFLPLEIGVREDVDAFIVTPWAQFYYGALGVALAKGTGEPYARTFWMRLPFALAGLAGALLPLAAVLALAGGDARRRQLLTLGYLAALCTSISLILHLRQARYYALVLLLAGALFHALVQGRILGRWSVRRTDATLAALLVLVLHTFLPAFAALSFALVADAALEARRRDHARLAAFARAVAPVAVAALVAIPSVWFYRTFAVRAGLGAPAVLRNAKWVAIELLRYELLGPALLFAVLRLWLGLPAATTASLMGSARSPAARYGGNGVSAPVIAAALRRAARWLWLAVAASALLAACTPWFFSRYLIATAPALVALTLLEGCLLADALARSSPRVRALCLGPVYATLAVVLAVRLPEIAGRVRAVLVPERGPVDWAIDDLRARYADPSRLVIATNYEGLVYDFYLGSRVYDTRLGAAPVPPDLRPDVVIPRRFWNGYGRQLEELLARDHYEPEILPVADRATNGMPELLRDALPSPPASGDPHLVVYHRAESP